LENVSANLWRKLERERDGGRVFSGVENVSSGVDSEEGRGESFLDVVGVHLSSLFKSDLLEVEGVEMLSLILVRREECEDRACGSAGLAGVAGLTGVEDVLRALESTLGFVPFCSVGRLAGAFLLHDLVPDVSVLLPAGFGR
jgi:hypothetical protein